MSIGDFEKQPFFCSFFYICFIAFFAIRKITIHAYYFTLF